MPLAQAVRVLTHRDYVSIAATADLIAWGLAEATQSQTLHWGVELDRAIEARGGRCEVDVLAQLRRPSEHNSPVSDDG